MTSDLLRRARTRRGMSVIVITLLLVVLGVTLAVRASSAGVRVSAQFITATPEGNRPVRLDTSLYLPDTTPAPAVLLAHGFGGDKTSVESTARALARHGYVVLTYSARGFGHSGGDVHLDAPDYEVKDASLLLDWLAARPEVASAGGTPQLAVAGSSYGGGLALLLAGSDPRVKAVAADITWNDLTQSLFPNSSGPAPGVFKKLWVGTLFGEAFGPGGTSSCGRFAPTVCAAYQASVQAGTPTPELARLLRASSPSTTDAKITAPTLLTQGEQDSLFPLDQADANAHAIAATGTPVKVVWRSGGHDDGAIGGGTATGQMISWFDGVFSGAVGRSPAPIPFQFAEADGSVSSDNGGSLRARTLVSDAGYPGLAGSTGTIALNGPPQTIGAPAAGTPAAITSVPGLGGVLTALGRTSAATTRLFTVPSQTAAFASAPLRSGITLVGASRLMLSVTPRTSRDATLFVAVRDAADDGTITLPAQLVSPVRLTGLTPGRATIISVRLPGVVRPVSSGHRLVVTVSTTDFAYALPQDARSYTVALTGASTLAVPTLTGARVLDAGHPLAWLITGLAVVLLTLLAVALELRRRRRVLKRAPELAEVPVVISGLVKEYAGGYRAVDDISLRVERGQVVGLLGPNGAGKTTALRVLVGLITPTAGTLHVFGEPITPGAAVLSRVGAFIEGPGFLPHLSGRENLRLFWQATGRPEADAGFDTALEIAGLGASIDRRVRAYSQGMRQRLGIAQAMLGLPELLVLDEPTNGLDPPQIAEMREVLKRYAETGRTVVVSSHLLAEVEQTCSHVVVMHKGRVVAAGSVVEIAGAGGTQLAVDDPQRAGELLAAAGMSSTLVPARRALEDVFLDLIGAD